MKRFFSLIALVCVFAACQPEVLETSFEKANAVVNISVTTIDVQYGKPVTTATLTSDKGTVSGQIVTLTGDPAIEKQMVKITAKYLGVDYSTTVSVNSLLAGGIANYTAIIVVGVPLTDVVVEATPDHTKVHVETAYLSSASISHNDMLWAENNSEFLLTGEVSYEAISGAIVSDVEIIDENYRPIVESFESAYDLSFTTEAKVLPIVVSAYSYYTAYVTRAMATTVYSIFVIKDGVKSEIGKATVVVASSTEAQYEEMAHPNAHGTYHHGHGHDSHGTGANAGGGISFAE